MSLADLALLAGGMATRLGGLADATPKVLMPVAGEPFLAHLLRHAKRQGFSRVVLCLGHLAERVEEFLATHGRFGLDIAISHEGPTRRGTGGALRHALPLLSDPFFLGYGDSLLPLDAPAAQAAFLAAGQPAMMTVLHNRDQWDASNLIFAEGMVRAHDKTLRGAPGVEWIDAGVTIFRHAPILAWPETDPWDLSTLTGALARQGRLAGHLVHQRFHEIGRPETLAETDAWLRAQDAP